jgi:hypothetical protein
MKISELIHIASDLAEAKVIQKFGENVWIKGEDEVFHFTEEAQDLFNDEYDFISRTLIEYIKE